MRRALCLILAMMLLLATPVLAEKKRHEEFQDLKDAEWAVPNIAEAQAKGLMRGTGDGKFEPNAPLTRAQAITVAIRVMGLEEEAQALKEISPEMLPFADLEQIAQWARPYVALAVQKEIVPVSEDGLLRAEEKATRLWVSVLLVRALGYDAEAQAKMAADLPFKDAALVPARLRGYVAAAVDHELIKGFEDQTFRPNQPLTRAQAATLLNRTDNQLAELGKLRPGSLKGTVTAVDAAARTVSLQAQGGEKVVTVAENAALFFNEQEATLADFVPGTQVMLVIGPTGEAILLSARKQAEKVQEAKGTIASLTLPEGDKAGLISLKLKEHGEKALPLSPEVEVKGAALADLKAGDRVEVRVVAGTVIAIKLEHRAEREEKQETAGLVVSVTPATEAELAQLTLRTESGEATFAVAPEVRISHGHRKLTLAEVTEGARVELKVVNQVVLVIRVEGGARQEDPDQEDQEDQKDRAREFRATLVAVHKTDGGEYKLTFRTDDGKEHTVPLAADAEISRGKDTVTPEDLKEGDRLKGKLEGGVITEVEVQQ